ncbi:titin-like isoform X3 [Eriocheir sinensis]|uniref:titin-like isoform X3 n=1 Tax=Eriocheir sinensis TaxID=95602 RepID=UPI0021C94F8B|nr:titin-like isoform X3 [Eriocheir sinensis]
MRIITRRRVKVRVTVKRGDGSVTSSGWEYHGKREDEEEEERKPAGKDASGRVTPPADGKGTGSDLRPTSLPLICVSPYSPVHNGGDVGKDEVEDAEYADATKSSAYESVDTIYEDVGKKSYRVRFGEDKHAEENGSLYSTGAIPKRGSSSTLTMMDEEEERDENMTAEDESKGRNGRLEEDDLYEPVGEYVRETKISAANTTTTTKTKEHSANGTRKIEVILSSSRDDDDNDDEETGQTKDGSKAWKRGKVEVKFSPWQTGKGQKATMAEAFSRGGSDVRVEQNTELSFSDRDKNGAQSGSTKDESSECPYEVHHRSNIRVSAEDLTDSDGKNGTEEEMEVEEEKRKRSASSRKQSGYKFDEEDFSDEERKSRPRGRSRVKKRMVVRVDGRGHEDAPHALLKTFSRTVVTFGRESSGSLEKVQDALTDGKLSDSDKDDSDSSVIFLETYGVDPRLLRNDGAEEDDEAATKQNSCPDSDSSSLCLPAAFALEPNSESLYSERSNDGSCTDQGSQTDSSTDTLVLDGPLSLGDITTSSDPVVLLEAKTQEDVEQTKIKIKPIQNKTEEARSASEDSPEDLNDFDSSFQRQSDEEVSSRTSSFFSNFEEKLEQAERQFPNLQAEDLLVEERERRENFISSPQLACEGATEVVVSSTEEKRVDETLIKTSCIRKLEPKMGQYYSSVSGAGASKGGDVSGSLPSSPRSSEGWRISMASTATVGSSATAGSDDTVAKDMSELSSVNSCLSDLDETQTDGKVPPAVAPAAPDPDATAKAPPVPQRKKQTSIKDAIDELESIEQAAQTLLLKRQCSSEDERLTPVPSKDSSVSMPPSGPSTKLNDKMSPQTRKKVTPSPPPPPRFADDPPVPPEGDAISEKLEQSLSSLETSLQEVDKEMLGRQETAVAGGSSSPRLPRADQVNDAKAEVKPPLPPNLGVQQPKLEVKRRLWTKSKETQPYISRESYNEEEIIKELERLRRSFQENDLNDFLDNLDNTAIEYDIEEAFLTQLLQDISEDVEALPEGLTEKIVVRVDYEATTDTSSEASSEEVAREGHGSPSASSKLEKVKEKITERIRKRKASKSSDSGSSDAPSVVKDDDTKSESSVVENQHITPQTESSTPSQPLEHESSALIITPDVAKAEDTKKGFNIAEFFKKGSPKYLRKKYKERKNRKSDLITTSESESEDPEACKKDSNGSVLKKNYENQSSLKGSHRSLNGAQDTKKEVRFDLDSDARDKDVDSSPGKITGSSASKQPSSGEALTRHVVLSSQRVVTCEPQQQETVVLKESQEIVQVQTVPPEHPSYALPVVVEDINSRAESILPKLPERVKPPRRKKMIPTPVQEISNQSADQDSGSRSRKVADARAEFLKSMAPGKESAPTLLPCEEFNVSKTSSTAVEMKKSTETTEDIPDSTLQSFNQQLQPTQQFGESAVTDTDSVSSPPRPPFPKPSEEIAPESLMQEDASVTATIQSTSVASDSNVSSQEEVLVAPIPVTSVASISIASPEPTKVVQPPRTLPLPVIQESMHEDQISLLTPSEPTTVSSSYGDTTPATPPFEDNLPSLYDNVNPFKAMLEQEKMMEDIISAQATAPTCQATAPTYQATAPTCQATAPTCQTENKTEVTTEIIEQNAQPIAKNLNLSLSQAARKSPEAEKFEIVDIDSLAAITAEMFKFAEEMEKEVPKKTSRPPHRINTGARRRAAARDMGTHTPQRRVETREVGTEPYTTPVRRREMSTTIGIQTETSSVRTYHEAASQTDTEYETDLETESEIEDNQNKKYDASKWTFGPVREQTLPLASPQEPQLQHLHKQQQRLIQELQKQTVMQPNKEKEKPEAPPRHYQDKMPLKVVAELKNILADLEHPKPAPSRAVVQPPRWDDQLLWPHALQELGLDESTLLNEIEQILGVGSLTSKSGKASEVSPARPEKEKEKSPSPVKPKSDRGVSQKPQVPERASSRGVWTPGKGSDERDASGPSRIDLPDLPSFKDQPNVWTPARAGSASPNLGRKEYRKITYDNQSSPQRRPSQENITVPSPEESFAWRDANVDKVARSPTSTLPKVQNPTVTLLQKKREGQIPGKRPEYLKPDDGPKYRPDDKLYVIKREYESEEEGGAGRRFAVLGPKKVAGVGPTTNDGVPTTLKSGVKSEHQGEWYKRMFDSLHKIKDDDHIIIKYKVPRARYGGYMSEPEGYDSDIGGGTLRYATVDRRRGPSYEADPMTSSLPRECLIDLDPYAR